MPDYSHLQGTMDIEVNWLVFESGLMPYAQASWTLYLETAEVELELHQTVGKNLNGDERGRTFSADYVGEKDPTYSQTPTFPFQELDAFLSAYVPDPLLLPFLLDDLRAYVNEWADAVEDLLRSWSRTGTPVSAIDEERKDMLLSMRHEIGDNNQVV